MEKILLLGEGGMAGHVIKKTLQQQERYELITTYHTNRYGDDGIQLDIADTAALQLLISTVQPAIIINCIGALLRQSKAAPHEAIYINAYFPHLLVSLANSVRAKIVHLSTDCVFSGRRGTYTESDVKDAQDIYGLSKSLGEIRDEKHITIRTSIIGPELKSDGEGLFSWFMKQKGDTSGYSQVWWSGVTTLELAKFISYALSVGLTGVVQLTNGQPVNKFNLLQIIQSVFGKDDIVIMEDATKKADKTLISSEKIKNFRVLPYADMIRELRAFMQANKLYYSIYDSYL